MNRLTSLAALIAAATFATTAYSSGRPTYTVTDLGLLPAGEEALAFGINNAGQVTGWAQYDAARRFTHAFKWTDGAMEDLGVFDPNDGRRSHGTGINDAGHVVGASEKRVGWSLIKRAFLHDGTTMIDLGAHDPRSKSFAFDINSDDQVVGFAGTGEIVHNQDTLHGFLWQDGAMSDLGTLGGRFSQAVAINDSGQIVGSSLRDNGPMAAFLWEDDVLTDLGTLGGRASEAWDINDGGQIVGWAHNAEGVKRAFLYEGGKMTDLGALPGAMASEAFGINDGGTVVGSSWVADLGPRAFMWRAGNMVDLNDLIPPDSGWTLQVTRRVNAGGQIVGYGRYAGKTRAFLLMPSTACPGDVDGDGDTDHSDLGALLSAWCAHQGDSNWNPNADLDGDGHVGHGDLGILLPDWNCGTGP